jgi:uncharacterized membrane protein YidH (DUF202 family)
MSISPPDDHEDGDPGLARARTSMAWTRTALSFAAVGGVVLKRDLILGLLILAAAPVIWQLGRLAHHRPGRLKLVTVTIVAVALVALGVVLTQSGKLSIHLTVNGPRSYSQANA